MADASETTALLREIRDNQREALALQREYMTMYQQQLGRIERINDRAEVLQGRAGKAIRIILMIAIPLVCLLLVMMLLPYFLRLIA
ncbi:hypothetical protein [Lysobacter solisilvae (ex Woo and Kim 2020)]|uniref:Uncharacterized protein n=1 Tax=Agrilutibacter terrestris TaxID=2865112 RepID=A0A7H0FYM8_9GAMM|nr:hypothetical protein [Lysobacter terrestris]QNP41144.1 hypothetical protein H8B22_02650 [Lysobacter terrestris]